MVAHARKTQHQFEAEVLDILGCEYQVLSEYINSKTKVKMRHNVCGSEYNVIPNSIISGGTACPICAKKFFGTLSNDKVVSELKNLLGGEYDVVSKYKNSFTNILIRHNKCGNTFASKLATLRRGGKCTYCRASYGERTVYDTLQRLRVPFSHQEAKYNINGGRERMVFDFGVTDEADNLIALIEYDGAQHSKPIGYFGGVPGLIKRQEKDAMKDTYCHENGIPLLRISYKDDRHISSIVTEFITTLYSQKTEAIR